MGHDVFVCHASSDEAMARLACSHLEERGIRSWLAPRDLEPGSDYVDAITDAIKRSRLVVLIFSSSSNSSPHVRRELEIALNRGIRILPIRVDASKPSASLEYYISTVQWLDAAAPPLEAHLARLARAAERILTPTAVLVPSEPFPHESLLGHCTQCGHQSDDGDSSCRSCGAPLEPPSTAASPQAAAPPTRPQLLPQETGNVAPHPSRFATGPDPALGEPEAVSRPRSGPISLRWLSTALTLVLSAGTIACAIWVVMLRRRMSLVGGNTFSGLVLVDPKRARSADNAVHTSADIAFLIGTVAFSLLIPFFFQAARNTSTWSAKRPRWTPGWNIGGWFIPLANLIIPVLAVTETWHRSPARSDSKPTTSTLLWFWWAAWIVGALTFGLGSVAPGTIDPPDAASLHWADPLRVVAGCALLVASILLIIVINRLAERQSSHLQ